MAAVATDDATPLHEHDRPAAAPIDDCTVVFSCGREEGRGRDEGETRWPVDTAAAGEAGRWAIGLCEAGRAEWYSGQLVSRPCSRIPKTTTLQLSVPTVLQIECRESDSDCPVC